MLTKLTKEMTESERIAVENTNNQFLQTLSYVAVGTIWPYAGDIAPEAFMICDGSELDKNDYPELFDVIGYTYGGAGTTFKIPDLRGKSVFGKNPSDTDFNVIGKTGGAKKVTLTVDQMPSHKHTELRRNNSGSTTGWGTVSENGLSANDNVFIGSAGGNQPHENMPPYMTLNYIIKVKHDISNDDFRFPIDQTYNATSENAQSGLAVAEAITDNNEGYYNKDEINDLNADKQDLIGEVEDIDDGKGSKAVIGNVVFYGSEANSGFVDITNARIGGAHPWIYSIPEDASFYENEIPNVKYVNDTVEQAIATNNENYNTTEEADLRYLNVSKVKNAHSTAGGDVYDVTYINAQEAEKQAEINRLKKEVANLISVNEGKDFNFVTDTTSAYSKTVPSGAAPNAILNNIGGRTLAFNQLIPYPDDISVKTTGGTHSVTDGVITFQAEATGQQVYFDVPFVTGHKYFASATFKTNSGTNDVGMRVNSQTQLGTSTTDWQTISSIITSAATETIAIGVVDHRTSEFDEIQCKNFMCVDLTQMFGVGNEPATVEEFKAIFPNDYYEYSAGELMSGKVNAVVTDLQTYPIPLTIQSLPGYGWSAGTVCNEVDWVNKKYIQRVGSVDLGTLGWAYYSSFNGWFLSTTTPSSIKPPANNGIIANIICSKYATVSGYSVADYKTPFSIGINVHGYICVRDSAYTTAAAFKTAVSGVTLYYELATPIETDISDILTDNFIEVEAGGSITFEQVNNTLVPVPSTQTYWVDI